MPDNVNEPLGVALHDGNSCSLSNRRLTVLMMYAAVYGDSGAPAVWKICNSDTEKLENLKSWTVSVLGGRCLD